MKKTIQSEEYKDLIKMLREIADSVATSAQIERVKSELHEEIAGVGNGLGEEVGGLRKEMSTRFDNLDRRLDRIESEKLVVRVERLEKAVFSE